MERARDVVTISGGDKLKARLAEITTNMENGKSVKIGFFANATYPDGTSVAQVAVWNDWGTKRIPPRPFFRTFAKQAHDNAAKRIGKLLKANDYNAETTLDLLGTFEAGKLKAIINKGMPPPNAPYTIAKKGFDHPLLDTGHMRDSVAHEVEK